MRSLCVIPARSGSKGLKDKNILDLNGKPVLAYTIEACLKSNLFDKVFVVSDNSRYMAIAREYGAEVPFMEPVELAQDHVSSTEPVLWLYEKLEREYDLLWCMQPTSPLRKSDDIIQAHRLFEESGCDFVLSTTEIDPHYFHWALCEGEDGFSKMYFGRENLVDRKDLKPVVYRPNGMIKVGRTEFVLRFRHFFGDHIRRVEVPDERSIHIRSRYDLDLCEYLIREKRILE